MNQGHNHLQKREKQLMPPKQCHQKSQRQKPIQHPLLLRLATKPLIRHWLWLNPPSQRTTPCHHPVTLIPCQKCLSSEPFFFLFPQWDTRYFCNTTITLEHKVVSVCTLIKISAHCLIEALFIMFVFKCDFVSIFQIIIMYL